MVPIVSQLHFPLLKLHCHKLQQKKIINLVKIYYTVTQHKPSVRMDTYIDFNDSYIFLTATYILELFCKNTSHVSGVSVCIFVALYVGMFVARANKVEGTIS